MKKEQKHRENRNLATR